MSHLGSAIRFLFRRQRLERQMDDELRAYIELRAEEHLRSGKSAIEAQRLARAEFGGVEQVKEGMRDAFAAGMLLENLSKDAQYAWRLMRKSPGFTLVAVLTLALGIGGNTAIFSVVKSVLLDPLPYADPGRLMLIWNEFPQRGVKSAPLAPFQLQQLQQRSNTFESIGGIWANNAVFLGDGEPEQVKIGSVTGNFFPTLGATPLLGRTLVPDDEGPGKPAVALLSYGLWQRRFGGDPKVIGRTVRMENGTAEIIGVMPPEFRMAFPPEAQVPAEIQAWLPFRGNIYGAPRDLYYLRIVGRLAPEANAKQAGEEIAAIAERMRAEFSEYGAAQIALRAVSMHSDATREVRPALLAIFAGVGLVLLIACVNVANLLLARAGARRKEIAMRTALGATRWRIVRQLMMESALLAAAGGAAGLLLAWWGVQRLAAMAPANLLPAAPAIDWPVLGFTAVVALGAGALFGIIPALHGGKVNLLEALQGAGVSTSASLRQGTRGLLVVSEVALGFVLLAGAGLMIRTFMEVQRVNPGFNAAGVLTFEMDLPRARYPGDEQRLNLVRQVEEKLRALPRVEAVGGVSHLPLDDYSNWYAAYAPEGASEEQKKTFMADHRSATPGYLQAVGAQLVAGRWFEALDEQAGRAVIVIDQRVAREAWPNQEALGKKIESQRFRQGEFVRETAEVIGVVRHVQHHALTRQVRGQIYIPFAQSARWHISFAVRASGDPAALAGAVRGEVAKLDKDLAIAKVRPMEHYLTRARAASRFTMVLAAIFAGFALALAAVGIYGVLAYSVTQRRREFGVRLAIGARPRDITRQVLREGMTLVTCGLAVGIAGALALTRALQSLLFGVSATDAASFGSAALVIPLAAVIACWAPARRAARQDPVATLRVE